MTNRCARVARAEEMELRDRRDEDPDDRCGHQHSAETLAPHRPRSA
jgi:hypothetical protein